MAIKTEDEVSRRTRDLYERALAAIDRKNFSIAITFLLDAIALEPEFLQAHRLLMATQKKQFGGPGTTWYLKKGVAMLTTMPGLGMGWAALNNKPKEAMAFAYKMLNQDPTNTQGLDLLIRAAQKMELSEVGVLAAEAAVTASPNNLSFLAALADLYRACDKPEKAQDVYEHMLEVRPHDPDIIREMKDTTTLLHMKTTKIDEAESYRDLIKDTDEAVKLEQEAKVIRSDEMIDKLIESAQKEIQEQPDNLSSVRKLADLYLQKGDYDGAQKALESALSREAGDSSIQKALGDLKIRRVDSKLKLLKAELDQKPNDPQITKQFKELQVQREKLMLEECERRVKNYPNDLSFRFELGSLYYRRGRITEALQEFQLAQRSPQHQIVSLNYMGLCFRNQNMLDLAENQFQKAEKASILMDQTKKDIIYNLAETYEQMKRKKEALDQFKKLYEVDINYRDVARKIMELTQALSDEEEGASKK